MATGNLISGVLHGKVGSLQFQKWKSHGVVRAKQPSGLNNSQALDVNKKILDRLSYHYHLWAKWLLQTQTTEYKKPQAHWNYFTLCNFRFYKDADNVAIGQCLSTKNYELLPSYDMEIDPDGWDAMIKWDKRLPHEYDGLTMRIYYWKENQSIADAMFIDTQQITQTFWFEPYPADKYKYWLPVFFRQENGKDIFIMSALPFINGQIKPVVPDIPITKDDIEIHLLGNTDATIYGGYTIEILNNTVDFKNYNDPYFTVKSIGNSVFGRNEEIIFDEVPVDSSADVEAEAKNIELHALELCEFELQAFDLSRPEPISETFRVNMRDVYLYDVDFETNIACVGSTIWNTGYNQFISVEIDSPLFLVQEFYVFLKVWLDDGQGRLYSQEHWVHFNANTSLSMQITPAQTQQNVFANPLPENDTEQSFACLCDNQGRLIAFINHE